MGPIRSSRLDRNVKKRKQSVCIAISVGPIAHLGLTETLRRETYRLQSHLGEAEIPIVRPKRLGFLAVAMSTELGGAELDIWCGTYVDMRK